MSYCCWHDVPLVGVARDDLDVGLAPADRARRRVLLREQPQLPGDAAVLLAAAAVRVPLVPAVVLVPDARVVHGRGRHPDDLVRAADLQPPLLAHARRPLAERPSLSQPAFRGGARDGLVCRRAVRSAVGSAAAVAICY